MTLRHNEIFNTCITEVEHVIICSYDYYIAYMHFKPMCAKNLNSRLTVNIRPLIKRK